MIKFKTKSGQKTIETPTIGQYYAIQDWLILTDQTGAQLELISILSGASKEELKELDAVTFTRLWTQCAEGPLSALVSTSFESTLSIDGVQYGFIDLAKLTIGELADMDTLKAHPQVDKQLHKMMAILYRELDENGIPVGYTIDGFNRRAELFLNRMKISHVIAAIDFFFHITKVCLKDMMASLELTMQQTLMDLTSEEMNDLTLKLQGDGIDLSSFLPATTSLSSTTAQGLESSRSLTS